MILARRSVLAGLVAAAVPLPPWEPPPFEVRFGPGGEIVRLAIWRPFRPSEIASIEVIKARGIR